MKIFETGNKVPPAERLECPLCGCQFEIQIGDLYDLHYTAKGKVAFSNCPSCNTPLKIYENKCINQLFKLYFSLEEIVPKHIL